MISGLSVAVRCGTEYRSNMGVATGTTEEGLLRPGGTEDGTLRGSILGGSR